jgi:hypothetical protein
LTTTQLEMGRETDFNPQRLPGYQDVNFRAILDTAFQDLSDGSTLNPPGVEPSEMDFEPIFAEDNSRNSSPTTYVR